MPFTVLYTVPAKKDVEKLDSLAKKRFEKKLVYFLKNPLKYATKLTNLEVGEHRWRVGDLRVIFDIDGNNVYIARVRHRRDVYKKQ